MHGEDSSRWPGYLLALRHARERFRKLGCTATDHGHPTARTADLDGGAAAALFDRVLAGKADVAEQELFRAQMLTEMARMSVEDGLVMQIHPGSHRNHNRQITCPLRARCGSRYSDCDRLCACVAAAVGSLWQRHLVHPHTFHFGRIDV